MLGLLMHGHTIPLQIFVGGADVRVSCLVTGYHDTFSIGQVTDARILQTVELVGVRPTERCSYLVEHVPIDTGSVLGFRGLEVLPEQVVMIRLVEHLQVDHCLDKLVIQTDHAVPSVLRDTGCYENLLFAQMNVLQTDVGNFTILPYRQIL